MEDILDNWRKTGCLCTRCRPPKARVRRVLSYLPVLLLEQFRWYRLWRGGHWTTVNGLLGGRKWVKWPGNLKLIERRLSDAKVDHPRVKPRKGWSWRHFRGGLNSGRGAWLLCRWNQRYKQVQYVGKFARRWTWGWHGEEFGAVRYRTAAHAMRGAERHKLLGALRQREAKERVDAE